MLPDFTIMSVDNEGKTGKTWYEAMDGADLAFPYNARWNKLNSENTLAVDPANVNWGYNVKDRSDMESWMTTVNHMDMGDFDSSWELGVPRGSVVTQADQRWFNGIGSHGTSGNSVDDDTARLKCFKCDVQYGLVWDQVNRQFAVTGNVGADAWADCLSNGTDNFQCEYSSGVCFVEERRLFGYVTLVRKGCKQAQACYKNKAQNFLVQAGRQCWPGDARDTTARIASRPNDVMADEWIYQLVKGGSAAAGFGLATGDVAAELSAGFDSTFTDTAGLAAGFTDQPLPTSWMISNPDHPLLTVKSSSHGATSAATQALTATRPGNQRQKQIGPSTGSGMVLIVSQQTINRRSVDKTYADR